MQSHRQRSDGSIHWPYRFLLLTRVESSAVWSQKGQHLSRLDVAIDKPGARQEDKIKEACNCYCVLALRSGTFP